VEHKRKLFLFLKMALDRAQIPIEVRGEMPRAKPDNAELEEREQRKQEWIKFRKENLITQEKFADLLGIGRRTIQMVEKARISPYPKTLRKFAALKAKYSQGAAWS
jgi:DNA-binding XRE family transcriptional regulator